jgi:hypothetical protein
MRQVSLAILLLALPVPAFAQSEAPSTVEPDLAVKPDAAALAALFPNGAPSLLTPESIATNYRLPAIVPSPDAKQKVPFSIKYSDGPLKYELGTNVSANKAAATIIPQVPDPHALGGAAGGAGEVKGHVAYAGGQWELYGTQKFGVTQADGLVPVAQDSTTFGSTYQLPDWLAGGKIGASLELAPSDERKTRVEYRQKFGPAEGFVAAEQTFVPDRADAKHPSAAVRGGVIRKF